MAEPTILFDAFGGSGFQRSWRFAGHVGTLQATTPDEVAPLLEQVEQAAADGLYAAGFVAYEAAHALNADLPAGTMQSGLPLAWFALYGERREVPCGSGLPQHAAVHRPQLLPGLSEDEHRRAVERIRAYIAAGDCYQVNYTFPLQGLYRDDPQALYRTIGQAQQAPFCAYIDGGPFTVLSASPELFFSLEHGRLTTRPMKGTAPRGRWAEEDLAAREALRRSPKEQAENLMIVDLLRNDLGRLAVTGSVTVESLFDTEPYPTLHQLTSTITARLRPGAGLLDIFRALFPCGSVTGAPKRRSMEIIAELETSPRGVYCGAIGCVAPGGEALFSVPIRTLLLDRSGQRLSLCVGSGITWDSEARGEYAECLTKAAFTGQGGEAFRLIESLRLEQGSYPRLERHLQRLRRSAGYFGFSFDEHSIREALAQLAHDSAGLRKVRLLLAADGSCELSGEALEEDDPARPLRLGLSELLLDSRDPFRYHKTSRRELLDRARAACPGCDEVFFLNERGEVCEGSYHSIVVQLEGRSLTPPLDCGLLPGIMRRELLDAGVIEERTLTITDLLRAEAIWLVNSVRGWRPACLSKGDRAV